MVMQQPQYAPPAPSTFDPTQVYVPNRFQQSYVPQSYVDQYGLQSAFPLAPGVQVPGGEGGGEVPVIMEPPPVIQPPIDGFTPQTFMDAGTYENPGDLGSGGAPAPEGGYFQQEGAPTYEGIGGGAAGDPSVAGVSASVVRPLAAGAAALNPFLARPQTTGMFGTTPRPALPQPPRGPRAIGAGTQRPALTSGQRALISGTDEATRGATAAARGARTATGGGSGATGANRQQIIDEMRRRGYEWRNGTWERTTQTQTPRATGSTRQTADDFIREAARRGSQTAQQVVDRVPGPLRAFGSRVGDAVGPTARTAGRVLSKASPYLTAADFYLGLPNVPFSQYNQRTQRIRGDATDRAQSFRDIAGLGGSAEENQRDFRQMQADRNAAILSWLNPFD